MAQRCPLCGWFMSRGRGGLVPGWACANEIYSHYHASWEHR